MDGDVTGSYGGSWSSLMRFLLICSCPRLTFNDRLLSLKGSFYLLSGVAVRHPRLVDNGLYPSLQVVPGEQRRCGERVDYATGIA